MKRTKTAWMKAEDFARSLPRGIGVNLLVMDMAAFRRDVLGADIIHAAPIRMRSRQRRGIRGHVVLAGAVDKPHGLRECHVVLPGWGYVFVASTPPAG